MRSTAAIIALALWALPLDDARGQTRSNSEALLGSGPPDMHMKLEKTLFGVDVATVDIWFGADDRGGLRQLAAGHGYSSELAEQIAAAAVDADHALVQLEFQRDVSLDQFLDGVHRNLQRAHRAGLIDDASLQRGWANVRRAFGKFSERGFREGDRILYRARPSSLRTVVLAADGRRLLSTTTDTAVAPITMLAGYFAPGSDFREPLIRSFLR